MRIARPCRCRRPLWDGESCVRCGHSLPGAPERKETPWLAPRIDPWTHAGVIRALRAFAFFCGRPPVRSDWELGIEADRPSLGTVEQLFGSFAAAVQAAGLSY
jgi:hypothetical protein